MHVNDLFPTAEVVTHETGALIPCPTRTIPPSQDVMIMAFRQLDNDYASLLAASAVCREWREILHSDSFCLHLFQRIVGICHPNSNIKMYEDAAEEFLDESLENKSRLYCKFQKIDKIWEFAAQVILDHASYTNFSFALEIRRGRKTMTLADASVRVYYNCSVAFAKDIRITLTPGQEQIVRAAMKKIAWISEKEYEQCEPLIAQSIWADLSMELADQPSNPKIWD